MSAQESNSAPAEPAQDAVHASTSTDGDLGRRAPKQASNPFPGLRPFEEKDYKLFFGRNKQVQDLLRRVDGHPFLAVVGVSGSGKSSLVRAGLIKGLRQGFSRAGSRWLIALMRPGKAPVKALGDALEKILPPGSGASEVVEADSGGLLRVTERYLADDQNLLIVVDQFEEVFRFKHLTDSGGEDTRASAVEQASDFVRLLHTSIDGETRDERIHIVITMRSDFLGDCAQFHGLPEHINKGQYLVPRLTPEQQREIIENPVLSRNARISELLVQRLLADVGPEPDQLPILQHALSCLWQHWAASPGAGLIDMDDYKAIGTSQHAMDRHAEDVYGNLSPSQQWVAKRLFQRITAARSKDRPLRRASTFADILSVLEDAGSTKEECLREVISCFRNPQVGFLTCAQEGEGGELAADSVIDISHESLCVLWARLKQWVEQEGESAEWYGSMSRTADKFRKGSEGLYRDPGLTYVFKTYRPGETSACDPDTPLPDPWSEAWSVRYDKCWTQTFSFLKESKDAHEQLVADEQRRLEVERLAEQRRKELELRQRELEVEAAYKQREFEIEAANIRNRNQRILVFLSFAAVCFAAIVLYVGLRLAFRPLVRQQRAGIYTSAADNMFQGYGSFSQERAALLDLKSHVISEIEQNSDLARWESFDRITQPEATSDDLGGKPIRLVILPDRIIATSDQFGNMASAVIPGYRMFPVALKVEGKRISQDRLRTTLEDFTAIGSHGKYALAPCNSKSGDARLWNFRTHEALKPRIPCASSIWWIEEARNSQRFATMENESPGINVVRLFDASGRELIPELAKLKSQDVALSSDGGYIAIILGPKDKPTLQLWRLPSPETRLREIKPAVKEKPVLSGVPATSMVFSSDDALLAIGTPQGDIDLYDLPHTKVADIRVTGHNGEITALAFSHKKHDLLASAGKDKVVRVHEFVTREQEPESARMLWSDDFGRPVAHLAFSPNDKLLGLAIGDNTGRVKEAATGFETVRVTHGAPTNQAQAQFARVNWIDFTDDDHVVTASDDQKIRMFGAINAVASDWRELSCGPQQVSVSQHGELTISACLSSPPTLGKDPRTSVSTPIARVVDGSADGTEINRGDPVSGPLLESCLVAASADGNVAVSACSAKFSVFAMHGEKRERHGENHPDQRVEREPCLPDSPASIAVSFDGKQMAVGDKCGNVSIHSIGENGMIGGEKLIFRPFVRSGINLSQEPPFATTTLNAAQVPPAITAVAISPGGTMVAWGTSDGYLKAITRGGRIVLHLQLDYPVNLIEFSPQQPAKEDSKRSTDSDKIAYAAGTVAGVRSLSEGSELSSISSDARISAVAFSDDAKWSAAGSLGGKVYVFWAEPLLRYDRWRQRLLWLFGGGYDLRLTHLAKKTLSWGKPIYALRFWIGNRILLASEKKRLVTSVDQRQEPPTLALTLHSLDIDGSIERTCHDITPRLTVPDPLDQTILLTRDDACKGVK